MKLQAASRLILSLINQNHLKKEFIVNEDIINCIHDWNSLSINIIEKGLGPSAFKNFNNQYIPYQITLKLQQSYYITLSRNTILYQHFRNIVLSLNKTGIQLIALKGIYLSEWLYQDIGLRQMSDIDILVHKNDGFKCIDVLKGMGYLPVDTGETEFVRLHDEEIIHYRPMVKDGVSIEVHIKLHKDTEKYLLDNETLWRNATLVTLNGVEVLALGKYDQLIHLCIHLDKHFKVGHVQFTCFMDIVNYFEKYIDDFDWNQLIYSCHHHNCLEVVFKYIVLCEKYMYVTVPKEIIIKFQHFLTEFDEDLFFRYLNGEDNVNERHGKNIPNHIRNIARLNFIHKLRYVRDVVFPPKAFMVQKYLQSKEHRAKSKDEKELLIKFWWLWYPYRWYIGLIGLLKLVFSTQ